MSRRLQVGSRVTVTNGDGIVRWMGTDPEFAAGSWVGVEL
jgi:dynactin complex subunit